MDTREKIVDAAAAARIKASGAIVVAGYFDPMIAWHARWLANFKKPGKALLILIASPENTILPDRAREELIASLAVVDHVAEFSDELAAGAVRLESEDRKLFPDLLELVHARNRSAACAP